MTLRWKIEAVFIVSLVIAIFVVCAHAQPCHAPIRAKRDVNIIENPGGPAVIQTDGGTVIINTIHGVPQETYDVLAKKYGVTESALKIFFKIIEQKQVPLEDLDNKLREIATLFKQSLDQLQHFMSDDPIVTALRQEAKQALESGEFDRAVHLLDQASARDLEAIKQLQETVTKRFLSAAASKAENGRLKHLQLAYREAASYYRQAAELIPKDKPLLRADYLDNSGTTACLAGDYAEAEVDLRRALKIRKRLRGSEHPDVSLSLHNLATCYLEQRKYPQAEPLARRAVEIDKKVLGDKHPACVAAGLNNLAAIYQVQRQYDRAEEHYIDARKIAEEALGPNHPAVASNLNNLAILYRNQHRYPEAELLHLRARKIDEETFGPNHPEVARDLNNLATLYPTLGKEEKAEPLHLRAIAIAKTVLGPDHPSLATYLIGYANTLCKLRRHVDANPINSSITFAKVIDCKKRRPMCYPA